MFKSLKFVSLRLIISLLFIVSAGQLFAQDFADDSGKQWYICEIKSKQKANEKKYFGPYASKEETLANWMYKNLPENKKYCVALKLTYMTSTPSSYFGREWKAVKEDYEFDRDYFIKKYSIELDEKIEAAYLKSQGKDAVKAAKADKKEKSKKTESETTTEVKEKKSKAEKTAKAEKKDKSKKTETETTAEVKEKKSKTEKSAKTDKKEKTENTKEPKENKKSKKEKEIQEKTSEKEVVKETKKTTKEVDLSNLSDAEKAKENAKLLKEQNKEISSTAAENAKLEEQDLKEKRQIQVINEQEQAVKNAEDLKNKNKEDFNNAKNLAAENGDSELYTLPEALDQFYKKERRDALARQIRKEAETPKIEEKKETAEPVKTEVVTPIEPEPEAQIETEPEPALEPAKIEVVEEVVQDIQPDIKLSVPFTFIPAQPNVSRYKKEYLQDFIPQENYVPQAENTLKQRIDNPNEVDSKGQTLLMKAAKSGNDWQIKILLDSGADVNMKDNDGWTALMYACRYQESISTLKTLIQAGAKIKVKNNYDSSALILAANYNDNPEILSYLLKYYSNSEKELLKCFILLLSSNQPSEYLQIAKVNIFMEKSIPLNTFYQGKTPLMYAAQYGNSTKTLKLLLDNDALTTIRSSEGKTAFDYAAKNSNLVHDENYWALNKK